MNESSHLYKIASIALVSILVQLTTLENISILKEAFAALAQSALAIVALKTLYDKFKNKKTK